MTITPDNIKILKSEVMLDTDDGGGQATAIEVVDGQSNNLFPDIPEASRVYGKIEVRKVYPAVDTESTEALYGSHFLFTKIPDDEKVNVCAFTTRSWTDRRKDAQDRLETYLAEGTQAQWELMERQLRGQRAILLMGMVSGSPPVAGQSLVLTQDEGLETQRTQYVRVVSVSTELREFFVAGTNNGETFKLMVCTCEITDPLLYEFKGFTPHEYYGSIMADVVDRARIRETRVADANNYYSARKLKRDANKGDATLHVDSVYTNLVPSAQAESPLTDLNVSGQFIGVTKGTEKVSYEAYLSVGLGYSKTALGSGVYPGTLKIRLYDDSVITDNGINQIMYNGSQVGTIQYDSGAITWLVDYFGYSNNATIEFDNAFPLSQSDHSDFDPVTESNRGLIWNKTLYPAPVRGSLKVTFVNSGKHYTIADNGDGSLGGSSEGVGVGSVNYETGTVTMTFNAYPDIGSYILYQWGDKLLKVMEAVDQEDRCYVLLDVADFEEVFSPIYSLASDPTISWLGPKRDEYGVVVGTENKTATIDRNTYAVTGDATGTISLKEAKIYLNEFVALGTVFNLSFKGVRKGQSQSTTSPVADSGQSFTIDLSGYYGEINPWSLELSVAINMSDTEYGFIRTYDANASLTKISALQLYVGSVASGANKYNVFCRQNGHIPAQIVGIYDATTRKMVITPQIRYSMYVLKTHKATWSGYGGTPYSYEYWTTSQRTLSSYSGLPNAVTVSFKDKPDAPVATANPVALVGYGLTVKPSPGYVLDPNNVSFRIHESNLKLNSLNQVILVTDQGNTVVGSFSGDLTLKSEISLTTLPFPVGASTEVKWLSVGCVVKDTPKNKFAFYTPIAPIRGGSFQLVIRPSGREPIILSPDPQGNFNNDRVWGWVDYETGFVVVVFRDTRRGISYSEAGDVIRMSPYLGSLETYNDIVPQGGNNGLYDMTVPEFFYASDIAYNAVALTYLPLSSDLLGLDPVRLPADGRVPCFRSGDMVVVTDHLEVEVETPVAGMIVPVGETRLSTISVEDALGRPVTACTFNLTSGIVSFNQDFSINGLELPLTIKATVQDLAMLSDVQVSGVLSLNKVLTHSYSAGCLVSSVIYIKDMQARAYNKFHQAAWNTNWLDVVEGETISATYNTVFYPIEVTNSSAIKERWAIVFISATTFKCIGEFVGEVGTGSISEDYRPVNPNTRKPYFTLKKEGWGGGWANGYVMRFNTDSATFPVYIVRTILQGESTDVKQGFTMQLRGDIDNEEE